ncbi:hypothetical protein JZY91_07125 [Corynebacterium sp. CNCTC7651]|uniref:hypothetical protein n=1 Tax=Corynebacterium sp. CNCTC7651 TaxID=2815361 RepID=UPI001F317CEA|nr:hypothetical protein [Corynebacterium sp. CNCTC7651]UIZ91530.1 hypothetical protein JZY91_07125 [Corynebacterium sp. CNCTC7651]
MRPNFPLPVEQILATIAALFTVIGLVAAVVAPGSSRADGSSQATTAQATTAQAATTLAATTLAATTLATSLQPTTLPATQPTGPARRDTDAPLRRDLRLVSKTEWDRWERVEGNPNAVRIFYTAGVPECSGEYVQVRESPTAVNITLYSGAPKGGPDACIALAVGRSMVVTLEAPLGNRAVTQSRNTLPMPARKRDLVEIPTVTPTYAER